MTRTALILALIFAAAPALAASPGDSLSGAAWALDGDTIGLLGPEEGARPVTVRLWGIDAPEMDSANGAGWQARAALDAVLTPSPLSSVIGRMLVSCQVVATDRYKRPVAICALAASDTDLGLAVIRAGWAIEYRTFTRTPETANLPWRKYAEAEAEARAARRGLWAALAGK